MISSSHYKDSEINGNSRDDNKNVVNLEIYQTPLIMGYMLAKEL